MERLIGAAKPLPLALAGGSSLPRRALVHASLATTATVGRRGRHLTGTFCLTGDTMEGIIQCLVFLKAFSVRSFRIRDITNNKLKQIAERCIEFKKIFLYHSIWAKFSAQHVA